MSGLAFLAVLFKGLPDINGPVDVNVFYRKEADLHGPILQEKIDDHRTVADCTIFLDGRERPLRPT